MRNGKRLSLHAAAGLVAAALLSSPAHSQTTSLNEALASAYRTNPDLEAQRAELRATDELVPQALAGYRPQVFINGGVEAARGQTGRLRNSGLNVDGDQNANRTTTQIGLSVRQNLYAGGGTAASVDRAENLVRAGRAQLVATQQNVLLDGVQAYVTLWEARSVLDLALSNEQRLRRQLDATRDRFNVGDVARTDVSQAEARLSRSRADVEAAKADLAAAQAEYRRVIGEEPGVLQDPKPLAKLPPTVDQALAIASTNPQVIDATYNLAASRNAVRSAVANLLPSVDLTADASYADQPTAQQPWQEQASVGLEVSIPLYQGGAEYADVRQARARAQAGRALLESALRRARETVVSTWDQLFATRAAIRSFRDEVKANRIALEGVQQEALFGSRTVLDVLDQEQELFTSQVNLVRSLREEIVWTYQLKAAVGELTAQDLGLAVVAYDPEAYYERNRNRLFGLEGGGEAPRIKRTPKPKPRAKAGP